jgi:hypothetical protein
VVKILQEKSLPAVSKGELFVQMKKRIKKFKQIMASTSNNEQVVVWDLLRQHGLEEYAVDLTPKYNTL